MPLKVHREVVITVGYRDLERFAVEWYPFLAGYSFVATQECGNDSSHRFNLSGRPLSQNDLTEWAKGNINNWLLLDKLCADGHIEPGTYIVEVSW